MTARPAAVPAREMNLYRRHFDLVASGEKTIEVRVRYPNLGNLTRTPPAGGHGQSRPACALGRRVQQTVGPRASAGKPHTVEPMLSSRFRSGKDTARRDRVAAQEPAAGHY